MSTAHDELERALAGLAGDARAEALVKGYGPEVYGFLCSTLRRRDDADDAFAAFSENVWRGLPRFRGESSFRTWAYQVARHAALNVRRTARRREQRFTGRGTDAAERVALEVRSATSVFRRTDVKDRVRALREALSDDEKELLVLRVDRGLDWEDIARILEEPSATLRKRFERIKGKLRALAEKAGLLER